MNMFSHRGTAPNVVGENKELQKIYSTTVPDRTPCAVHLETTNLPSLRLEGSPFDHFTKNSAENEPWENTGKMVSGSLCDFY